MNRIFKIKKNHLGLSVVTSELAKNKGKIASILFSALLGISGSALATPVSIQGSATSENAVSIGSNSYATAVDGVATGQGSIATGQGFTREEFAAKAEENKAAIDAVEQAQKALNDATNETEANANAIDSLNSQIDALTDLQQKISQKAEEKAALEQPKKDAEDKLASLTDDLNEAQELLDTISANDKNLYLNFTRVLDTLDWNKLDSTMSRRDELANDLKTKVETDIPDFTGKFTDQQYREIIDGYINKQASFQGSVEAFSKFISDDIDNAALGGVHTVRTLFNDVYYNSEDEANSILSGSYSYTLKDGNNASETISLQEIKDGLDGVRSTEFIKGDGTVVTVDNTRRGENRTVLRGVGSSSYDSYYNASGIKDNKTNSLTYLAQFSAESLNTIVAMNYSSQRLNEDGVFNPFYTYGQTTDLQGNQYNVTTFYRDGRRDGTVSYDTLDYMLTKNSGDDYTVWSNIPEFAKQYNETLKQNYSEYSRILVGTKTTNGKTMALNMYDDNIHILSKFNSQRTDSSVLITAKDIEQFNTFYSNIERYLELIDWDFDKSAINLTKYRSDVEKVKAYNDQIKAYIELSEEIFAERAKLRPDEGVIEEKTRQMLNLRNGILDGMSDISNFFAGIEVEYDTENMDYYLTYAGEENINYLIKRINTELELYDEDASIVVESTQYGQQVQDAYDAAKKAVEDAQKELDEINKQIEDLTLTEEEAAVDAKKAEKQQELDDALARRDELEKELEERQKALEEAQDALSKTDLKDLGLRSQAHGSNAFASGNDSIAMGTNATVISNDGIAIGRDTILTGEQSIAIGADAIVTGAKSSTIGVNNLVTGDNNAVIGNDNTVKSNNVMVLGNSINIAEGFDGAVVLGDGSTVAKANPTTSITIQDKEYTFAGINPESVVSVGAEGAERQIINVAAGRISETSTDAVNGSQLYALAAALEDSKLNQDQLDEIQDQIDSAGWKVTIDSTTGDATGGTVAEVKNGNTVTFVAGDNIALEQTDTTITINAVATTDTKTTINAGNGLKAEEQVNGDNVVYNIGLDEATKAQIEKETEVAAGTSGNVIVSRSKNETGGNTYTVELSDSAKNQLNKDTSVSSKDGISVSVSSLTNANGGTTTNYEVSLSDATKSQLAKETIVSGENGISVKTETSTNANGGTTTNYVVSLAADLVNQIAKEENVIAGQSGNIQVIQNGTNETGGNTFVVELAKDVNLGTDGSFKAGDIVIEGNKISGVGTPVDAADVVNKDYVDNSHTTLSSGDTINIIESVTNTTTGAKDYSVSINKAGAEQLLTVKYAGDNGSGENSLSEAITFTGDEYIVTNVENGKVTTGLSDAAKAQLAKETKVEAGSNSNLVVSSAQNETGGNTYTVTLADQVDLGDNGSVKTGNVVINADGINAGNTVITNVAPAQLGTDAVNLNQLLATQTVVEEGDNVTVEARKNANGSTTYVVHSTRTDIAAGSNYVVAQPKQTGDNNVTYVVDLSENTKAAVDSVGKGWNVKTDDGKTQNVQMGDTVTVKGDGKNIATVTTSSGAVQVQLADDLDVNTVKTVKPAEISPTSREVVQGSQLYQTNQQVNQNTQNIKNLNAKVDRNAKQARKGIAVAAAIGSLPQPHISGKSMVSAASSHHRGEQAVAIGYSRLSDNGKHILKLNGASNVSGHKEAVVSVGYGYQW